MVALLLLRHTHRLHRTKECSIPRVQHELADFRPSQHLNVTVCDEIAWKLSPKRAGGLNSVVALSLRPEIQFCAAATCSWSAYKTSPTNSPSNDTK